MQFDISDLPIGEESELLQALKRQWDNGNRVEVIKINGSQALWFDNMAASYHHVISTNDKSTMINEYYSPFGEHTWEIKND